MKKLLLLSFLILFVIKGYCQKIYNVDSTKSFSVKNGSYVEDKISPIFVSINFNYGENDIKSFGFRLLNDNKNIFDFCTGTTGHGNPSHNSDTHYNISVYKVGFGRKINDDLSIGVDYVFSEKTNYGNTGDKWVDNANHNIGLFLSYTISSQFDVNFTSNSYTGNSFGFSLKLY